MRVGRSRFGWILVAIYLVMFVVAYLNATAKRGAFLYDIWLDILTLPYIVIVGRLFLQAPRSQCMLMSRGDWCRQSCSAACWCSCSEPLSSTGCGAR